MANKPLTIQDLYPDLSPEEQEKAEYDLKRYVGLVRRIYNRLEAEGRLDELKEELKNHKKDRE